MKNITKIVLGVIVTGAAGLFGLARAADVPPEVRVAYSGGSQVLVLAKADGSLEKALGTHVKWVQFASGADVLNLFAANAIDIANFGSSPAVASIVRKLPVQIVGVSGVIATYERLIARKNIQSLKDLEGKTVGYPPNSTSQYALEAAIKVNHLDRTRIKLVPLRPAELVAAYRRGDIDAGYLWAPFTQQLEDDGGHQLFATQQLQKDGYLIYNNYVVRTAFAKQYPDVVAHFLAVHQQKVNEYRADPEKAANLVAKELEAPVSTSKNTLAGLEYPSLAAQATQRWLGDGINPENSGIAQAVKKTAQFLAESGQISDDSVPASVGGAINGSFAKQAAGQH